ncbi:MAG: glycosyltransferase, partial [Desulfobacterales bacterium]|nr:glycosyltransferase [Desulfobacterales bacterium]
MIIVIPFYNHSNTLRAVVKEALDVHDSIMVVDDGSTDRGVDKLEGLSVHIVRHPKNLGKGAAILSAIK